MKMTVYKIRRIIWESYPVLVLCAIISLSAGLVLDSQFNSIRVVPLVLWMVPPINGINNNVCSILGARLGSALHVGLIEPKIKKQKVLDDNIHATWFMSIGTFLFTSAVFFAIALITGVAVGQALVLVLAFFVASMVAIAVTMLCTISLAFLSFTKGLDPDNVVIPIVTSIGDMCGVTFLLVAIKMVVI
jgi:mgtE-like transporter